VTRCREICAKLTVMCLAIRHGDREKGIGRIRVGLLRHAGARAHHHLVTALAIRGRAAGIIAVRAVRLVVVVEHVVERESL